MNTLPFRIGFICIPLKSKQVTLIPWPILRATEKSKVHFLRQ